MVILGLVFFSLYAHGTKIEADPPIIIPVPQTPKELIIVYAAKYNTPLKPLLATSQCESSLNPKAVGDHGLAKGIFQYHKSTFIWMSSLMEEELDYYSTNDQAKLTAFIFSNRPDLKSHWTCARKLGYI